MHEPRAEGNIVFTMPRRRHQSDESQFMCKTEAEPNLFELCQGEAINRIKSNLANKNTFMTIKTSNNDILTITANNES